jgi:beta-phosphoglucomutase-like phosphatase (HAD superfamily)
MTKIPLQHPVIGVDIDGILFDTPQQAVERWNSEHGTTYTVEEIFDHNAKHNKERGVGRHYHENGSEVDLATGEMFDDIFYSAQNDIANYLIMPGSREVLARLKHEYGVAVHALTARDKNNFEDVTLTALKEHFGVGNSETDLIDELHFSKDPDLVGEAQADKGVILRDIIGAHIMVEDSVANAKSSKNAGVATFVLSRAYNQTGHDWSLEETASDWDTLYHLISQSLDAQGFRRVHE